MLPATSEQGEALDVPEDAGPPATPASAKPAAAKSPAARPAAPTAAKAAPIRLEKWSAKELAEVRAELDEQARGLRTEITDAEDTWDQMQRDGGDGAGDDQADAGTKTFEREHELSLTNNSRDLLAQVERALERLADGTYGVCENCGNSIEKARLRAFPRATLCVTCKQREERR